MATLLTSSTAFTFSDFPEDVQVCILSFLNQSELARFECTSRRYLSLCRDDSRLWFSMCDRRWGSKTIIKKWGNGKISYKLLYKFLVEYETLIGFWRRSGNGSNSTTATPSPSSVSPPAPLVFFEWGTFYIMGSRVSPSKNSTYDVIKSPFLWISLTSRGKPVSYLDLYGKFSLSENYIDYSSELVDSDSESDLIAVNFSFIGRCYFVIEERLPFYGSTNWWSSNGLLTKVSSSGNLKGEDCDDIYGSPGSFPDRLVSEIYQHIANRTSPGGNGSWRKQKRREKEKQGRKKLEPEHFVKIVNYSPVPSRPLQGLWKGISDDINLEFYLITYDEIGGMSCRRVEDSSRPFNGHTPVFWSSNTTLMEPPFSTEEEHLYNSRIHLLPSGGDTEDFDDLPRFTDPEGVVSGMLHMNSSYDLVIPGTAINHREGEGRVWKYENGTIGFGFLRNNCVIDLKLVAQDGHLLDALDYF